MAISDTLSSIRENIENAYTSLQNKGATIPENKNIQNLASTISSITSTGGGADEPSNEWQPNPTWWDIKTILENDTRDYAYKVIYLYTNATIAEKSLALKGVAYATSDGAFYNYGGIETSFTHTWNLSKDKPCYIDGVEVYKTRYVIVYSNIYVAPKSSQKNLLCFYGLNTSNVTSMSAMFNGCYALQSIPELDTSNVTTMSNMFNYCYTLQSVPNLNTSNVTSMNNMFNGCYALQSIPNLDTSNVTNMSGMFNYCYNLQSVPNLNTSNVTNMNSMLSYCYALQTIPKLDTSNVTNMNYMFNSCYNLQTIPKLDTSNVTTMSNMFGYCHTLQSVPELDMINATSISSMFSNCKMLTNLKLYNIKISGLTIGSGTSYGNLLSQESLIHTIKQLWDYSSESTTYKLTMGTDNTSKLANVYVKLITATDEMIAEDPYINSKMPCEVCQSTDEGAMLIMDYAALKKWTIS